MRNMDNTTHAMTAIASGLVGAAALTLLHETARRTISNAPRMDVVGRRAIAGPMRAAGIEPPKGQSLQGIAMGMDLISNGLFYALIGLVRPKYALGGGSALGTIAGLAAVALPPVLGLGRKPTLRQPRTAAMTFAWYFAGAMAAAGTYRVLTKSRR